MIETIEQIPAGIEWAIPALCVSGWVRRDGYGRSLPVDAQPDGVTREGLTRFVGPEAITALRSPNFECRHVWGGTGEGARDQAAHAAAAWARGEGRWRGMARAAWRAHVLEAAQTRASFDAEGSAEEFSADLAPPVAGWARVATTALRRAVDGASQDVPLMVALEGSEALQVWQSPWRTGCSPGLSPWQPIPLDGQTLARVAATC